jgi:hypothetical protein
MNTAVTRVDWGASLIFLLGVVSKSLSLWQTDIRETDGTIDLVTGLTHSELVCLGLVFDLTGLATCLFVRNQLLRGGFLIWIASGFLLYHLAALLVVRHSGCDCLAGLGRFLGAPQPFYAATPIVLSLYLLGRGFRLAQPAAELILGRIRRAWRRIPRFFFSNPTRLACAGLLGLGLSCFILLRTSINRVVEFQGDEQLELMKGRLVEQGYPLYREIWSDQPPALTYVYAALMHWGGPGVAGPRLLSWCCFLGLLGAVSWQLIGRFGLLAALIFIGLFPTVPEVVSLALSATQETPMLLLAVLGGMAGWQYLKSHKPLSLGSCFLLFLLGFEVKFTALLFLVPLLGAAVFHCRPRRRCLAVAGILGLVPLSGLAIEWLCFGKPAVVQTISTHFGFHHVESIPDPNSFVFGLGNLLGYPALYVAFLFSAAWLVRSGTWKNCVYELLLSAVLLAHAWLYRPWWSYYQLGLGLGLSWVIAIGLSDCIRSGFKTGQIVLRHGFSPLAVSWLCALLVATLVLAGASQARSAIAFLDDRLEVNDSEWVQFLCPFQGKVRWAFSPQSIFAFHAGLRVPPKLAVLSLKRFWTGQISVVTILSLLQEYQPEVIAISHQHDQGPLHGIRKLNYHLICEGRDCLLFVRNDFLNHIERSDLTARTLGKGSSLADRTHSEQRPD